LEEEVTKLSNDKKNLEASGQKNLAVDHNHYQQTQRKLDATIVSMQSQLEQCKHHNANLQSKIKNLELKNQQLSDTCNILEKDNDQLQTQLQQLDSQNLIEKSHFQNNEFLLNQRIELMAKNNEELETQVALYRSRLESNNLYSPSIANFSPVHRNMRSSPIQNEIKSPRTRKKTPIKGILNDVNGMTSSISMVHHVKESSPKVKQSNTLGVLDEIPEKSEKNENTPPAGIPLVLKYSSGSGKSSKSQRRITISSPSKNRRKSEVHTCAFCSHTCNDYKSMIKHYDNCPHI